jgi:hypothetical protein
MSQSFSVVDNSTADVYLSLFSANSMEEIK